MKKLLILALVLVVAGGLFAQAAGPTVVFSGVAQYGVLMNFTAPADIKTGVAPGPGQVEQMILRWDVKLDDFTTAIIRFRQRGNWNGDNAGVPTLDGGRYNRAWIESNLLGYFGQKDIKFTAYYGMFDFAGGNVDLSDTISPFGVADVDTEKKGGATDPSVMYVLSVMNMVNVRATFMPNAWNVNKGGMIFGVDGGMGPVWVNILYNTNSMSALGWNTMPTTWAEVANVSDPSKGTFAFGVKFNQAIDKDINLWAYAGFAQNMLLEQTRWGVAAKVGYQTLATFNLGATGFSKEKNGVANYTDTDSWFNRIEARLQIVPIPVFGLDLGTVLNIDQDRYKKTVGAELKTSMLSELDIRANLFVNKTTTFSVGYFMVGVEGYESAIGNEFYRIGIQNSRVANGGLYTEAKLTW
jgi:hypothetical protein